MKKILQFKRKKLLLVMLTASVSSYLFVLLSILIFGVWNVYDYQINDIFYRKIVEKGKGPEVSKKVVYVRISDSTYEYLKSNVLDRRLVAEANNTMARFDPNAIMYDIIFAQPSGNASADSQLASSLKKFPSYLPFGLAINEKESKFSSKEGYFKSTQFKQFPQKLNESGKVRLQYAERVFTQNDFFAESAAGSGHITGTADPDGVFRHLALFIKADSTYIPSVNFSMMLDYFRIPFDSLIIRWGCSVTVPALKRSLLEKDLIIPIDSYGRVFIPYAEYWQKVSRAIDIQEIVKKGKDPNLQGALSEWFGGSFVFVGDISTGISDLGTTTLEPKVPLVAVHAAMFNAFLSNGFYSEAGKWTAILIVSIFALLMTIFGIFRRNFLTIVVFILEIIGLFVFAYFSAEAKVFLPVASIFGASLLIFMGIVITLQIVASMEGAFIRDAFGKYVPKKVIDDLIERPELLQLGGEEKEITILFSDIEGFTSISEKLTPSELVKLLNLYLTEMTKIINENGGTVDKFIGDGILAEFGAPLPLINHVEMAIRSGLQMQHKLKTLNEEWKKHNWPILKVRVGINTGKVIVGNMGSNQVFDYTVVGDPVNLAARLESANKQYGTYLMVSEFSYNMLSEPKFIAIERDTVKVKGKDKPVKVYEVIAEAGSKDADAVSEYFRIYSEALQKYLHRDFLASEALFIVCLQLKPSDPAATEFIKRCNNYKINPPDEEWDGSYSLENK